MQLKNSVVKPTLCVARVHPARVWRATARDPRVFRRQVKGGIRTPQSTGQTTSVFHAP